MKSIEEVIEEKNKEIVSLIKEIDSMVSELRNTNEEEKRKELLEKIHEKEKELRSVRQIVGKLRAMITQFDAILPLPTTCHLHFLHYYFSLLLSASLRTKKSS